MTDKILAKINTEYELFFMQMMSCTKELLYSRSREIEMKKRVYTLYRVSTKGQVEKDDIPMQNSVV